MGITEKAIESATVNSLVEIIDTEEVERVKDSAVITRLATEASAPVSSDTRPFLRPQTLPMANVSAPVDPVVDTVIKNSGFLVNRVIKLSKVIKVCRMSKKKFKHRCKNLRESCVNKKPSEENCDPHVSLENLQNISKNMEAIIRQSDKITDDWKEYKELKLGNRGYINMTINFPEISEELTNVKKLINRFNIARRNLWKFKDVIKKFRVDSHRAMSFKYENNPTPESRKEKVVTRLENKSPPYGALKLNEISLRAYSSP